MKFRFLAILALSLSTLAWGASSSKKEVIQVASTNPNHAFYTYNDRDNDAFIACILDGPNKQVNKDIFHRIHNKVHKLTDNAKKNAALIKGIYQTGCLKAIKGKKFFDKKTCRESRINRYYYGDLPRYIVWLSYTYTPDKTNHIAQVYNSCPIQIPDIKAYENVNLSDAVKENENTLSFKFKGTEVIVDIATVKKKYNNEMSSVFNQNQAQLDQNRSRCDCNLL